MLGRTLFRYFFIRNLKMMFQFFLGITLIAFLVDFVEFTRRTSTLEGYNVTLALAASAMRVPMILQTAIPFVVLFSAMATLTSLNRRYELVVTRAAGVSAWQFLAPLCALSLLTGVVGATGFNALAALALDKSQQIEASFSGPAANRSDGNTIPWLRQQTEEGVTIIGAATTAERGLLLSDAVFVRIGTDGAIIDRTDAKQAVLRDGAWHLSNAVTYRVGQAPVHNETMEMVSTLDPIFIEEQFVAPELIPFHELPRKIAAARSFGLEANALATQLHSLIALPALLVAMTLIAATVSMRFARMGQSVTIILGGVLAGFLLYVVSVLVKAFGSAGFVPPVVAAWFPVLVAGFFGVTFLLYREDG